MNNPTIAGYTSQEYRGEYIGDCAAVPRGPHLREILERIRMAEEVANQIAYGLENHADAVFGPVPEENSKVATRLKRSGVIGEIEDALDELNEAYARLRHAAERNCGLV